MGPQIGSPRGKIQMLNRRLSLSLPLLATFAFVLVPINLNAQPVDSKTKPSGSISGRVTTNDKPAPDVVVVVQSQDRPAIQQPPARAKTDANGHYRLGGLAAGQYQISVIAPAMALAESASTANNFFGMGKSVVLAAGEDVDDIDIKLVKGGVITGRVTDADDKPVVDQRVNLQIVDQSGNVTRQLTSTLSYQMTATDDRGIYRVFGLSAGRYRVSVGSTENGFTTTSSHAVYPLTYYGATNDPNRATIVELQEGSEATNIDIHLGHAGNSYVATGRMIDADTGQPLPGVRLMYGPVRQGEQFFGGFVGMPTGSRGEFRLEGLEPGRYGVSVASMFGDASFYSEPILFNVTDSDVSNLELRATRGLTLSGVVVFEGSRTRELQQQISSLRMVANVTSTSNPRSNASSSAILSSDGTFQIGGVRPGRVNLFLGAFTSSALRGVTILRVERGSVDVTKGFELQAGESISDLRVTAALGAGTIRGTVRTIGGELPTNARLNVTVRREGGTGSGNGLIDARGRFVISNLVAGTYDVMLVLSFNQPGPRPMQPQKQTVNVSDEGETLVDFIIDLTPKEGGP
jgi:protocatechuate 3,4-dioxygenase beta subunit